MLNYSSEENQNGVTCRWVRYDRAKQRQGNRYRSEQSLVEELGSACPSPDVEAMEFLRLCIDGEDVELSA